MILVVVNGTSICNCGCRWWSTWITCELICDILWDMWRLWYICDVCDIYVVLVIYMCCWWYIYDVGDVCYIYLLFVWMECKKQKGSFQSLCRVQWPWHSAKWPFENYLGICFAEWNGHCTWQSDWKQPFLFVFYIPSKQTEDIYNKHHQHHIYIINITYISPTPHIYHKRHIYITNVTCLTIY